MFADFGFGVGTGAGRLYGVGSKDIIKTIHFVKKKKICSIFPVGLDLFVTLYLESSIEMSFRECHLEASEKKGKASQGIRGS